MMFQENTQTKHSLGLKMIIWFHVPNYVVCYVTDESFQIFTASARSDKFRTSTMSV